MTERFRFSAISLREMWQEGTGTVDAGVISEIVNQAADDARVRERLQELLTLMQDALLSNAGPYHVVDVTGSSRCGCRICSTFRQILAAVEGREA